MFNYLIVLFVAVFGSIAIYFNLNQYLIFGLLFASFVFSNVYNIMKEKKLLNKINDIKNENSIHLANNKLNETECEEFHKDLQFILDERNNGFINYVLIKDYNNSVLKKFKTNLNEYFTKNFQMNNDIINILESYVRNNYNTKTNYPYYGTIGTIVQMLNAIGENNSELLAINKQLGSVLQKRTVELLEKSKELSSSSTSQAASLEETAASIEEITSISRNNTENAIKMSKKSIELKQKSIVGHKLAEDTNKSIDQVNERVKKINSAVEIIDKIAFQTNILSLNAAVEAATAGASGKGFAVVASEVRNLAHNSAQAAKEIKAIVLDAILKAEEGKQISNQMIRGFEDLNSDIEINSKLINDVALASKEQLEGIAQINDAVNSLDKQTQQNAQIAYDVEGMTVKTLKIAERFITIADRSKFKEDAINRTKDINLMFEINSIISDHLVFKNNTFKKVFSRENSGLKNHLECALGQFIKNKENTSGFVQVSNWSTFKDSHKKVHDLGSTYIQAENNSDSQIELGKKLEEAVSVTVKDLKNLLISK